MTADVLDRPRRPLLKLRLPPQSLPSPPCPSTDPPKPAAPPEFQPDFWLIPMVDSRMLDLWLPMLLKCRRWPVALPNNLGQEILPLKPGIIHDLLALLPPGDEVAALDMRETFHRYRMNEKYTYAVARPGAMRHDLDGVPVEPVAECDRRSARVRLAQRRGEARGRARRSASMPDDTSSHDQQMETADADGHHRP